jgi:prepilin-type N-terminal cleavage/methylation domain-containing protein
MKRTGFTLIELLVVISIIAAIIALAIPNYLGARQRANDSKKKSEMAQLKNALRLYYNDFNKYPCGTATPPCGVGNGMAMYGCGVLGTSACSAASSFSTGAADENVYMKKLPTGFLASVYFYYQGLGPNSDDFCLRVILDNKSDPDIAISQSRCATACGANCSASGRYCVCAD